MLGSAVDIEGDAHILDVAPEFVHDHLERPFPLLALHADLLGQIVVFLRVQVHKRQVFQLRLDGVHAQAVRQGRIDVQRFAGNGDLPVRRLEFQGAHVVQTVGQLDEHHADVLGHGQNHLAQAFGLLLLARGEVQARQLGHAVHQLRHFRAEVLLNHLQRAPFAVLHTVVQQARRDGRAVHHQFRQRGRDGGRVDKIRLARLSLLVLMRLLREMPGALDQLGVVAGMKPLHALFELFQRHYPGLIAHAYSSSAFSARARTARSAALSSSRHFAAGNISTRNGAGW